MDTFHCSQISAVVRKKLMLFMTLHALERC
jgi:hypothetical protein